MTLVPTSDEHDSRHQDERFQSFFYFYFPFHDVTRITASETHDELGHREDEITC